MWVVRGCKNFEICRVGRTRVLGSVRYRTALDRLCEVGGWVSSLLIRRAIMGAGVGARVGCVGWGTLHG